MSDLALRTKRRFVLAAVSLCWLANTAVALPPDPTRPPNVDLGIAERADADAVTDLRLSAVLFAEGRRVAIVNGSNLVEGDTLGDARVVEIGERHVRFLRGGEAIEVQLSLGDVKQGFDPSSSAEVFLGASPDRESLERPAPRDATAGSETKGSPQ